MTFFVQSYKIRPDNVILGRLVMIGGITGDRINILVLKQLVIIRPVLGYCYISCQFTPSHKKILKL